MNILGYFPIGKKTSEAIFPLAPKARFFRRPKENFEKKRKNGKVCFCHFDRLEKLTRKILPLIFYLQETQRYPKMFLMPFYAADPFVIKLFFRNAPT